MPIEFLLLAPIILAYYSPNGMYIGHFSNQLWWSARTWWNILCDEATSLCTNPWAIRFVSREVGVTLNWAFQVGVHRILQRQNGEMGRACEQCDCSCMDSHVWGRNTSTRVCGPSQRQCVGQALTSRLLGWAR